MFPGLDVYFTYKSCTTPHNGRFLGSRWSIWSIWPIWSIWSISDISDLSGVCSIRGTFFVYFGPPGSKRRQTKKQDTCTSSVLASSCSASGVCIDCIDTGHVFRIIGANQTALGWSIPPVDARGLTVHGSYRHEYWLLTLTVFLVFERAKKNTLLPFSSRICHEVVALRKTVGATNYKKNRQQGRAHLTPCFKRLLLFLSLF